VEADHFAGLCRQPGSFPSVQVSWSQTKKPIFTIRHGVQMLIAVDGVVRGKKVGAGGHASRK